MGVYERKQKEKDILSAAIKLFTAKGYHATKMDDVAKQAKMSKGLIYFYYKNKEDLYMAVTKKAYEELTDVFSKILAKGKAKKGIEIIDELVETYFVFIRENTMYHDAVVNFMSIMNLYNHTATKDKIDPLIMESPNFLKLLDLQHEPAKIGIQMISQGVRDGSLRPDLQPEITFYTIWSMLIGFEKLNGPADMERNDIKITSETWKHGFLRLLHVMLRGSLAAPKTAAVQGSLF
ncbi:TetR/AcrR family transcriptional regulator [Litoribacter alkaliphilus]|uniref:TetR/AcrR family transcriptional regulator n=1 Tax=Litoribacter ruber TaxID=702568 RepID=A0AAP2G4L8_9BACT|nr:TetR/AcrR family transcriptional regulator [Litoribacter alkaliphilus]MBS9524645.1 TetR/AcrR family transcriptional regulator [Litoribacter alkaliphilus]